MRILLLLITILTSLSSFALTNPEATLMVKNSLRGLEILSKKTYCVKGTETCRIMVLLKDKATGKPANVFYDTFYSKERNVGSTCYFIPQKNNPNKYYVLSHFYTKAEPQADGLKSGYIKLISPNIAEIVASHDLKDVLFYNLKAPKLGTTQYVLAKMVQSENLVYIEGTTYDSQNPSVKVPIRIDYIRVK